MNNIILYSTHCPRCNVLTKKLQDAGVQYDEINDVEIMKTKGFHEAPKLEVEGVIMSFGEAIKWIKNYKGE